VPAAADLDARHDRALTLGARLVMGRSDDQEEPLRVTPILRETRFVSLSADQQLTSIG
jgi:hypothetical protein